MLVLLLFDELFYVDVAKRNEDRAAGKHRFRWYDKILTYSLFGRYVYEPPSSNYFCCCRGQ